MMMEARVKAVAGGDSVSGTGICCEDCNGDILLTGREDHKPYTVSELAIHRERCVESAGG